MLLYDQTRAKAAVKYLVDAPYFKHHVRRLQTVVAKPRSLPFTGEAETLNELVTIGRQNYQSMMNLVELAEYKRGNTKNDYQRKYMAEKRERERRVIELQEKLTKRTLTLSERRKVLLAQSEVWNAEKEKHIAHCAKIYRDQFGVEPGWEQKNNFVKEFWVLKKLELDQLIEEADQLVETVESKRRVTRVVTIKTPQQETRSPTVMSRALRRALDIKL